MIITEPNLLKDIKAGIANPVEVEKYLLNNFSAPALAHELADYILEAQATQKIVIPLDQFLSHFRIQGLRLDKDGNLIKETRGQYSKKKE